MSVYCFLSLTWHVFVTSVFVRVFESSGAVDFSGTGAHLIQDIELVLETSTLVSGIYFAEVAHSHSEII